MTCDSIRIVFLDGVYQEEAGKQVVFHALPHVSTREVGTVLEQAVRRIARYLARRGLLRAADDKDGETSNAIGEATGPPERAPARGSPYWASRALRIRSGADAA